MKRASTFTTPLLLAFSVLFCVQGAQAQQQDPAVARLKAKYAAITTLKATFTQQMSSDYMDGTETFSGKLYLQDKMYRVETSQQTVVTDGEATWIYNVTDNQVLINDYVEDETTFSLNQFFFNFDDKYTVQSVSSVTLNGAAHAQITLSPSYEDLFFTAATLWLRDRDDLVTQIEVIDVNETRMVFSLDDIEINPSLDPSLFEFKPPAGAEVIDLRS